MRTEGVYFAYMGRRNPWTDRVQILFGYRDPGRVSNLVTIGYRVSGWQGAKVCPFPLTLIVVLTTVLRYRVHCDTGRPKVIFVVMCNSYKELLKLWAVSYTHLTLPTNREV